MEKLIAKLRYDFQHIQFIEAERFCWSPADTAVAYSTENSLINQWALLHEVAHALLMHQSYVTDFELLLMESAAWSKAKSLAQRYHIQIDDEHIQDCLDTYRDWLYSRSSCPDCTNTSLQVDSQHYRCHNCHKIWRVSRARFKRPYRLSHKQPSVSSSVSAPITLFT